MTGLLSSTDMALARRIEAGHAHSAMSSMPGISVEAMAGGWAIFHRVDSPVTQAIGIGLSGGVAAAELDRMEAFFHGHGSAAVVDLCTLTDPSLLAMFHERGYAVREITNVLARRLNRAEEFDELATGIEVEPVGPDEYRSWARITMQGFAGSDDVTDEQVDTMSKANPEMEAFFGLKDGSRCATAAMSVHDGLATFFGDATLVRGRGQGLQLALLRRRIKRAAELGADLATASVIPGGISHRNYERAGFQLVYTRAMVSRQREREEE